MWAIFLHMKPGYAVAKITKGSINGPEVSTNDMKFTADPETYYVQWARFKDILVKGVDEGGNLLYQYHLSTASALPSAKNQGYFWQGDQYNTKALYVPHYSLDENKPPDNSQGDLTGEPSQLQSDDDKTLDVTYVYKFDGSKVLGAKISQPKLLEKTKAATFELGGGTTNSAYDFTKEVNNAIESSIKKGLIFEGQVGRNAGNVPYMGWGISIYRATQGAYTIQVKTNGKLDHTYTVTGLTGATYDLTDAINQVKKLHASGQAGLGDAKATNTQGLELVSLDGDVTGQQSIFDREVVLNYVTKQNTNIQYVDDDNGGAQVGALVTLNGHIGETVTPSYTIPDNYEYVSGKQDSYTFKAENNQNIVVHLKHQTEKITTGDGTSKTITRRIVLNQPDGSQKIVKQTATLTRTGTKDLVTGQTTWGDWSDGSWSAYMVPTIDGYTPSQTNVSEQTVNADTSDTVVNISYRLVAKSTTSDHSSAKSGQTMSNVSTHEVAQQAVAEKRLPQTGNQSEAGAVALGLATMLGMLGLAGTRRKEN